MTFDEWKKDLETRLELHLEGAESSPVSLATYDSALDPNRAHTVDVLPSATAKDGWVVYLDHRLIQIFDGPLAHMQASKFASDLLNHKS